MGITLLAAVLGLVGGLLAGGSPRALKGVRPIGIWMPVVGVLSVAISRSLNTMLSAPTNLVRVVFIGGLVLMIVGALRNVYELPGAALFAIGVGLNLAVILANGSMIYRQSSLISAGIMASDASDVPKSSVHGRPEVEGDRLVDLGQQIPVDALFIHEVVSPGDVAMAVGAGMMLFLALSPSQRAKIRRSTLQRQGGLRENDAATSATSATSLASPTRPARVRRPPLPDVIRPTGAPIDHPTRHLIVVKTPGATEAQHSPAQAASSPIDLSATDTSADTDTVDTADTADIVDIDRARALRAERVSDEIQVLVNLTADRAQEVHRYDDAAELSSAMSLIDLVDPAHDDGTGPMPGDTFWAARSAIRSQQPA
jgi:Family of unknown function (DUF5317)